MRKQYSSLLVACLVSGALWAGDDPFTGKWKENPSKSTLTDEMKVESAGTNRYTVTFTPGFAETIVADRTDQPGLRGTTLSITVEGAGSWKVIRKKQGRTLLTGVWTLSGDGKTLTDAFTGYQPDGSTLNLHYVYERTAGSSGFIGTWDSVHEEVDSVIELQIQPWAGDGLSFINPAAQLTKNIRFDGNDYPNVGPNVDSGAVSSGRRVDERSLEITNKFRGVVTNTQRIEISPDLRTLTMTVRLAGQTRPKNILVFERE